MVGFILNRISGLELNCNGFVIFMVKLWNSTLENQRRVLGILGVLGRIPNRRPRGIVNNGNAEIQK